MAVPVPGASQVVGALREAPLQRHPPGGLEGLERARPCPAKAVWRGYAALRGLWAVRPGPGPGRAFVEAGNSRRLPAPGAPGMRWQEPVPLRASCPAGQGSRVYLRGRARMGWRKYSPVRAVPCPEPPAPGGDPRTRDRRPVDRRSHRSGNPALQGAGPLLQVAERADSVFAMHTYQGAPILDFGFWILDFRVRCNPKSIIHNPKSGLWEDMQTYPPLVGNKRIISASTPAR